MPHIGYILIALFWFAADLACAEKIPKALVEGDLEGELIFPANAGHVDVAVAYGAKGDGKTDDTAALQRAISENLDFHSRILWLRNGTYLVSDTLETRYPDKRPFFGMKLVCQSRRGVIIRLADRAPSRTLDMHSISSLTPFSIATSSRCLI